MQWDKIPSKTSIVVVPWQVKKLPFRGYLQTDGYAGYNGLENVRHVGCWAHARRGSDEAPKVVAKGKRFPTAEQGLAYCAKLFKLEKNLQI